jgi:hypothetical protein
MKDTEFSIEFTVSSSKSLLFIRSALFVLQAYTTFIAFVFFISASL